VIFVFNILPIDVVGLDTFCAESFGGQQPSN
jgi:hypothetical protein